MRLKDNKRNRARVKTARGLHRVFGYGSLKVGARTYYVSGTLWLRDTGHAAVAFAGDQRVAGEIMLVDDAGLRDLDRREGEPNFYKRILIKTRCGVVCWGYEWNQSFTDCTLVPSGVWRFEHLRVWRWRYAQNPLYLKDLLAGRPVPGPSSAPVQHAPGWDLEVRPDIGARRARRAQRAKARKAKRQRKPKKVRDMPRLYHPNLDLFAEG